MEHFDVLIVGAGISGIGAACHLRANCPDKSFLILEGRPNLGGTWDLFRYPGIRSDSDMYTLGYAFKPWTNAKAIADGPAILTYLHETVDENGLAPHIRYQRQAKAASWSTAEARWTVEIACRDTGAVERVTCNFLFMCSGYYNYEAGYTPEFEGVEAFRGRIVHPQKWTDDIDYSGKRVVVIGSGATAVTLVPEMAKQAGHVTMLQRSPTYVVSRPAEDKIANSLRRHLPAKLAYGITRWKNVLLGMALYKLARSRPEKVKGKIVEAARGALGPDYDVETHFTPRYNPWDQRVCLVPDGDLFHAIRDGQASVVTDRIARFTENGILLESSKELPADLVVTATGLSLQLMSDIALSVDGKPADASKALNYKGMMFSGIPNLASTFGYTNASWTLKADLTALYVCRLLQHMDRRGWRQCTPMLDDPSVTEEPFLDFTSGYVQRALEKFPRQGSKKPWKLYQNYVLDVFALKWGKVDDGTMVFSNRDADVRKGAARTLSTGEPVNLVAQ